MGIWDRDKIYGGVRLTTAVDHDTDFILWDIGIIAEDLVIGDKGLPPATKSGLIISTINPDTGEIGDPQQVDTLSGPIARIARAAISHRGEGDLPAICQWQQVEGRQGQPTIVLKFVAEYDGKPSKPLPTIELIEFDSSLPF